MKLSDFTPNMALMSSPLNYVTIFCMVMFAVLSFMLIQKVAS